MTELIPIFNVGEAPRTDQKVPNDWWWWGDKGVWYDIRIASSLEEALDYLRQRYSTGLVVAHFIETTPNTAFFLL